MPKYIIHFGTIYAGTDQYELIEAPCLEVANEIAENMARDLISFSAVEATEDTTEDDDLSELHTAAVIR